MGPAPLCGAAVPAIIGPAGLRRQSSNPEETATAVRIRIVVKVKPATKASVRKEPIIEGERLVNQTFDLRKSLVRWVDE